MIRLTSARTFVFGVALGVAFVLGGIPTIHAQETVVDSLVNASFELQGATADKAYDWQDFGLGYKRGALSHTGSWSTVLTTRDPSQYAGAYQRIDVNQTEIQPIFIGGFIKGSSIRNRTDSFIGASIYAEIHLTTGKIVYWNSLRNAGTFWWRWVGFNTGTIAGIDAPISHIFVVPMIHGSTGTAYFDDLQFVQYTPRSAAVTIMVDDGETSTYTNALPMMRERGMVGSAAIVTNYVGQSGFMDWTQVKDLQVAGWEIVSHGVTHSDLTTLTQTGIRKELQQSKATLAKNGITAEHFAIPYGAYNDTVLALIAENYASARLYEQGMNPMGTFPYGVRTRGVLETTTSDEVAAWVEEAKEKGEWLVITYHRVDEVGDDAYYVTPTVFGEMLDVVKASEVPVVTYGEGLNMFKTTPTAQ